MKRENIWFSCKEKLLATASAEVNFIFLFHFRKILGYRRKDESRANLDHSSGDMKAFNDVHSRVTAENRRDWKEFEINIADLPCTGVNDVSFSFFTSQILGEENV